MVFLVVEGNTIFSARMNFIIIIPSYCYLLLTKQKGEKTKWCYKNVKVGKKGGLSRESKEINFLKDKHFKLHSGQKDPVLT